MLLLNVVSRGIAQCTVQSMIQKYCFSETVVLLLCLDFVNIQVCKCTFLLPKHLACVVCVSLLIKH